MHHLAHNNHRPTPCCGPKLTTLPPPPPAALFYRLKQRGFQDCDEYAKLYAGTLRMRPSHPSQTPHRPSLPPDCCRGRVVSLAWACRAEAKAYSACMSKYTGKLGTMKAMWVARGANHNLSEREWDMFLDDVIASD